MTTSKGGAKHEVFGKTVRRGRATNGATILRFVTTKKMHVQHRIPLVRMTGLVARETSVIAKRLRKQTVLMHLRAMHGHFVFCLLAMSAAHDFRKCYALASLFACGQLQSAGCKQSLPTIKNCRKSVDGQKKTAHLPS